MDAASNNSVEDIRGIKEKVNFLPTLAKYRVYIIDEVHMLSLGAFNALLKTLEEPPQHVKFILATTEPQKLLATILSRCQRFDFKKISNEDIIKRLKVVCDESKIQITEGALNLIAILSEGAARDALSILERCLQDGDINIDEDKIKDLVGIPQFTYVHNILKGILEKDLEKSLKSIEDVLEEGKDLENFLWEMIKHTKDILMYKVTKKADIYNEEEKTQIAQTAEKASKEELINIIYKLSNLESKMKISSQKTIIFETEIIKLCMQTDTKALEDRIQDIEKKLQTGNVEVQRTYIQKQEESVINNEKHPQMETKQIPMQKQDEEKTLNKNAQITTQTKTSINLAPGSKIPKWQNVLSNLKTQGEVMLYANLIGTDAVEINDMTVEIRFNGGLTAFRKDMLEKPENMAKITKEISMICGKTMQIKLQDAEGAKQNKVTKTVNQVPKVKETEIKQENPEDILGNFDIPINFVEEE